MTFATTAEAIATQLAHYERAAARKAVSAARVPHVSLPGGPVKRYPGGEWRYVTSGQYAPNPFAVAALDAAISSATRDMVEPLSRIRYDLVARNINDDEAVTRLEALAAEYRANADRLGGGNPETATEGRALERTAEAYEQVAAAVRQYTATPTPKKAAPRKAAPRKAASKAVPSKATKGGRDVRADGEGPLAGAPAAGVGEDEPRRTKRVRPKAEPADRGRGGQLRRRTGAADSEGAGLRVEGSEVGLGAGGSGTAGAGRDAVAGGGRRDRRVAFRPHTQADLAPKTQGARLEANLEALRTLKRIQAEDRAATADEQKVLARWSSWGSLPKVFDEPPNDGKVPGTSLTWAQAQAELKTLLTPQEYIRARRTIRNAHYTDAALVAALWEGMRALGFTGGEVLEPGSGSGTFMGMVPDDIAGQTHVTGVELDPTTAAIAQLLYPQHDVRAESFTETKTDDGSFDAAIGNVPFSDTKFLDPEYNPGRRLNLHNHFVLKALRMTRPGGLVAVITSRYTMDSQDPTARRQMAELGDLVGAIRLPSGAHMDAAGTTVVTDVLIFRRREDGAPYEGLPFFDASPVEVDGREVTVNDYWAEHPGMVLGTQHMTTGQKDAYKVSGPKDAAEALRAALHAVAERARAKGQTQTEGRSARPKFAATGRDAVPFGFLRAHTDAKGRTTFTRVDRGGLETSHSVPAAQVDELRRLLELRDTVLALRRAEAGSPDDTDEIRELRARLNALYDDYVGVRGPDGKWRRQDGNLAYGPVSRYTVVRRARKASPEAEGDEEQEDDESVSRIRPPQGGFRADPFSAVVRALEDFDEETGEATKEAIFTRRVVVLRQPRTRADSPEDALAITMDDNGMVDLEHVAALLGLSGDDAEDKARAALGTLVYDDPDADRLVPAAEYLSGDVRAKLRAARAAAARDDRFRSNVEALTRVIPPDLTPAEIRVKFGAGWVDDTYVRDFLREILRDPTVEVVHVHGSRWKVTGRSDSVAATTEWGIPELDAVSLAETLLGGDPETIVVKETLRHSDGTETTVVNEDATEKARAKAVQMQDRFERWVWEDPERQRALLRVYNDRFNSIVLRSYDGVRLELPGMSRADGFEPHPHQYAGIARIIAEPSVGLWHEVGAGKTTTVIAGAMELRRLGLARKPAIVVPNHMLEQVTREFAERYPDARILGISADDLRDDPKGEKRRDVIARAATGDWDAVIITHGAFKRLPVRRDTEEAYLEAEIGPYRHAVERLKLRALDEIRAENPRASALEVQRILDARLEAARKGGRRNLDGQSQTIKTIKDLEGQVEKLEERIKDRLSEKVEKDPKTGKEKRKGLVRDPGLTFEDTGIDYIFYDEAHGLKNLATPSGIEGMSIPGSAIAQDVHMKLHFLRQRYERVVTLMTATPISNSIREAYTMLRLGRPELLAAMGIETFDDFAGLFAEIVTRIEVSPTGGLRRKPRMARYVNVADFLLAFQAFASTVTLDDLLAMRRADGSPLMRIPSVKGGAPEIVSVPPSQELRDFVAELQDRAENLEYPPQEGGDNMLSITGEGRAAALDLRLVGRSTDEPTKLDVAAGRIAAIYDRDKDKVYVDADGNPYGDPGSLQIVFSDIGTPTKKRKAKKATDAASPARIEDEADAGLTDFNVYEALRDMLVARGVPRSKIAFIHDADSDEKKAQLFEDARTGKIAVLIGSTGKMGVGTNVQRRAVALHHLDAPWRPSDVQQREGRIVRQGNMSHRYVGSTTEDPEVEVIRYVTAGSFDAYIWQAITTKAMFIAQIMRGRHDIREMDDVGEFALSAQELTAIASEIPELLDRAQAAADWSRLDRMARNHEAEQRSIVGRIDLAGRQIEGWQASIAQLDAALAQRTDTTAGKTFRLVVDGKPFTERAKAAEALSAKLTQTASSGSTAAVVVGEFGGFPIRAAGTGSRGMLTVDLDGVPASGFTVSVEDLAGDKDHAPFDVIGALRRRIDRIPDDRARYAGDIAQAEDDIASLRKRVGAPFRVRVAGKDTDGATAVREARERFERLDAQVKAILAEKGMTDESTPEDAAAARKAKAAKALTDRLDSGGGFESIGEVTRYAQADPKLAKRLPPDAATAAKWATLLPGGKFLTYKDADSRWVLVIPRSMQSPKVMQGFRTQADAKAFAELLSQAGIVFNAGDFDWKTWRSPDGRTATEVVAALRSDHGMDPDGEYARMLGEAETKRRVPQWLQDMLGDMEMRQIGRLSTPPERMSKWEREHKDWKTPHREAVLSALETATPETQLETAAKLRQYLADTKVYSGEYVFTNIINKLEHDHWKRHGGRPSETLRKQINRELADLRNSGRGLDAKVDAVIAEADRTGDWPAAAKKLRSLAGEMRTPDRHGSVGYYQQRGADALDRVAETVAAFKPPTPKPDVELSAKAVDELTAAAKRIAREAGVAPRVTDVAKVLSTLARSQRDRILANPYDRFVQVLGEALDSAVLETGVAGDLMNRYFDDEAFRARFTDLVGHAVYDAVRGTPSIDGIAAASGGRVQVIPVRGGETTFTRAGRDLARLLLSYARDAMSTEAPGAGAELVGEEYGPDLDEELSDLLAGMSDDEVQAFTALCSHGYARAKGMSRFDRLVAELVAKGKSPERARALAAHIGRRKYGPAAFAAMAAAGRAKAKARRKAGTRFARAAGADTHPGGEELHHWWTKGPGLALWAESPTPWRTLHKELTAVLRKNGRPISPDRIDRMVSAWVHEVTGMWSGSDAYRVAHGGKPRGKRIGPG